MFPALNWFKSSSIVHPDRYKLAKVFPLKYYFDIA